MSEESFIEDLKERTNARWPAIKKHDGLKRGLPKTDPTLNVNEDQESPPSKISSGTYYEAQEKENRLDHNVSPYKSPKKTQSRLRAKFAQLSKHYEDFEDEDIKQKVLKAREPKNPVSKKPLPNLYSGLNTSRSSSSISNPKPNNAMKFLPPLRAQNEILSPSLVLSLKGQGYEDTPTHKTLQYTYKGSPEAIDEDFEGEEENSQKETHPGAFVDLNPNEVTTDEEELPDQNNSPSKEEINMPEEAPPAPKRPTAYKQMAPSSHCAPRYDKQVAEKTKVLTNKASPAVSDGPSSLTVAQKKEFFESSIPKPKILPFDEIRGKFESIAQGSKKPINRVVCPSPNSIVSSSSKRKFSPETAVVTQTIEEDEEKEMSTPKSYSTSNKKLHLALNTEDSFEKQYAKIDEENQFVEEENDESVEGDEYMEEENESVEDESMEEEKESPENDITNSPEIIMKPNYATLEVLNRNKNKIIKISSPISEAAPSLDYESGGEDEKERLVNNSANLTLSQDKEEATTSAVDKSQSDKESHGSQDEDERSNDSNKDDDDESTNSHIPSFQDKGDSSKSSESDNESKGILEQNVKQDEEQLNLLPRRSELLEGTFFESFKRGAVTSSLTEGDMGGSSPEHESDLNVESEEEEEQIENNQSQGDSDDEGALSLSFYREQQQKLNTPIRPVVRIVSAPLSPEEIPEDPALFQMRLKELEETATQCQSHINQANQLLTVCHNKSQFNMSEERMAVEKVILINTHKKQAVLAAIKECKKQGVFGKKKDGCVASLTLCKINLALKHEAKRVAGAESVTHNYICLLKCKEQVVVSEMLSVDKAQDGHLEFNNYVPFRNLSSDFNITLEVYSMLSKKDLATPSKKNKKGWLSKKDNAKLIVTPNSPGVVPQQISLAGTADINLRNYTSRNCVLSRVPYTALISGTATIRSKLSLEYNVLLKGFLTMFEDVSGMGNWERRYCSIRNKEIVYWKYPEDVEKMQPIGHIDMSFCVNDKIGPVPRDSCSRPNTFQLIIVRPQEEGDRDTLVSQTCNTMTSIKHILSADSKEERDIWCTKLNLLLETIRSWDPERMPFYAPQPFPLN